MAIEFWRGCQDEIRDVEVDGRIYLEIYVAVNGDREEHRISGWFPPEVCDHIKQLLGVKRF